MSDRVVVTRHCDGPDSADRTRPSTAEDHSFGLWCADGEAADQFIQFTEGVIAFEELEIPERVVSATLAEPLADGADLALRFELCGGRARGPLRAQRGW